MFVLETIIIDLISSQRNKCLSIIDRSLILGPLSSIEAEMSIRNVESESSMGAAYLFLNE